MEGKFMIVNIIDPSSTEFNRGSFCYAPYLLYNGLSELGHEVTLLETFKPEDLDSIPDADLQIITLWSYPQIETSLLLAHFLPFEKGKDNVYFAGYSPLIKEQGLPHLEKVLGFDPLINKSFLLSAMQTYPKYFGDFKRLLLSDCDMHLKTLEKGDLVYPMFTTYGCPFGCAFCPSTVNCGKQRFILPEEDVFVMLEQSISQGIRHIHFTDEDFFYDADRAHRILNFLVGKDMHLIALGSAGYVCDFISKFGSTIFKESGLEVLEIGFESGSEDLSKKMGSGKSLTDCEHLAETWMEASTSIFWLVLTFFPGETIKTLNATGSFMMEYGFDQTDVVGRLRTNGTKGGLGQFFQPYDGTALYRTLEKKGMKLTDRPVRLLPSYLPNSFLDSVITRVHTANLYDAFEWLELYNIGEDVLDVKELMVGKTIRSFIENQPNHLKMRRAIGLAILARLQVIK